MNAWAVAKHRLIGDILCERVALGREHRKLLEQLLSVGAIKRLLGVTEEKVPCRWTRDQSNALVLDCTQLNLQRWHRPPQYPLGEPDRGPPQIVSHLQANEDCHIANSSRPLEFPVGVLMLPAGVNSLSDPGCQ